MKRVCAWCNAPLDPESEHSADEVISHGICERCEGIMFPKAPSQPMREFLDRLPVPVMVVDVDGRIVAANEKAGEVLEKAVTDVEGMLTGEVIDCMNASLPGGCGKTERCKACAIRLNVTDTHRTGRSHQHAETYQEIATSRGIRRKRFLISTRKAGEVVLLRIDEVGEA